LEGKKVRDHMIKQIAAVLLSALVAFNRLPCMVRLHVKANSDSEADQAIKLRVRDAVVDFCARELTGTETLAQALAFFAREQEALKQTADAVLLDAQTGYQSSVSLGIEQFPETQYGAATVPAGPYRTLRVTLGEGNGANWWCVLFPPLCLIQTGEVPEGWTPEDGVVYKSFLAQLLGGKP
ncbi:MAG: stage II sporulation protein R, partial [Clostridia bacterium]|nr:stage II sporulation protein R [Clostridia bacterium]